MEGRVPNDSVPDQAAGLKHLHFACCHIHGFTMSRQEEQLFTAELRPKRKAKVGLHFHVT